MEHRDIITARGADGFVNDAASAPDRSIDIFCHCIDNFGDAGVAYRFARELKVVRPAYRVRLFIDDMAVLRAMVKEIDTAADVQELGGIVFVNTSRFIKNYPQGASGKTSDCSRQASPAYDKKIKTLGVADVMVETFACHIPEPLMERAYNESRLIINLEYLSAEDWVEDYHLKESLLGRGTVRKFYFMPGLRKGTGGLIFDPRLYGTISKEKFDRKMMLSDILKRYGIDIDMDNDTNDDHIIGTVFTYERGFDTLLTDLTATGRPATLLVFGEKSKRGMAATLKRQRGQCLSRRKPPCLLSRKAMLNAERVYQGASQCGINVKTFKTKNDFDFDVDVDVDVGFNSALPYGAINTVCILHSALKIISMPFLSQPDYDALLCCADFNIVRGEDSLSRAILSGRPFVWNAYIQDEKYQLVKVKALLKTMRPYYERLGGDYINVFNAYSDLMLAFNDAPAESSDQITSEHYDTFFKNLEKNSHIARDINYFMLRHCDLIKKIIRFIDEYQSKIIS